MNFLHDHFDALWLIVVVGPLGLFFALFIATDGFGAGDDL